MNPDHLYYLILNPSGQAMSQYGWIMLGLAFCFRWFAASLTQITTGRTGGWFQAAGAFILALVIYTPTDQPGRWLGYQTRHDVNVGETTVGAFLLERITSGADQLVLHILPDDGTLRAAQANEQFSGQASAASDLIYTFLSLRAQFVLRYAGRLWGDLMRPAPTGTSTNPTEGFLQALTSGDLAVYLQNQLLLILHGLGSLLTLLIAYLALGVISILLLLIAGLARFAPLFIYVLILFALPIGYAVSGVKAVKTAVGFLLTYCFVKAAVVLIIFTGFLMVESVVLQGYLDLTTHQPNTQSMLQEFDPGFLFTPAAGDILDQMDARLQPETLGTSLGGGLISVLIILVTTVYLTLKAPALLGGMLGLQSAADDLISSGLFIGSAVFTAGTSLLGLRGGGTPSDASPEKEP